MVFNSALYRYYISDDNLGSYYNAKGFVGFVIILFLLISLLYTGNPVEAKSSEEPINHDIFKLSDRDNSQNFDVTSNLYLGMELDVANSALSKCTDCISSRKVGTGIYTNLSPRVFFGEKQALLSILFTENKAYSIDLLSSFLDKSSSDSHFIRTLKTIKGSENWMSYYPDGETICRIGPDSNGVYIKVCNMLMGKNPAIPVVSVMQKFLDPIERSVASMGTDFLFKKGSRRIEIEAKMIQICKIINDCGLYIHESEKSIKLRAAPEGLHGYALYFYFSSHAPNFQVLTKFTEGRAFSSQAEMDSYFSTFSQWRKTEDFSNDKMQMSCVENSTSVGNNKVCKIMTCPVGDRQNCKYESTSSLE
ncbi:hypothetical protein [Niveispirillum cyanobacteriorum]|uniref:hypothetical protein n=1 Tax=Niveispirillum cyanobacteriorum TaxID=1612173 RepID=UPI00131A1B1E|nr:hypothetical protein [Niveispirillum cyanobacteriorum]GGE82787.1 hypothetical protein GCM10011317_45030 [Niveispirillum cyanobacteriorum]